MEIENILFNLLKNGVFCLFLVAEEVGNLVKRAVDSMEDVDSVDVGDWSFRPEDESIGRR